MPPTGSGDAEVAAPAPVRPRETPTPRVRRESEAEISVRREKLRIRQERLIAALREKMDQAPEDERWDPLEVLASPKGNYTQLPNEFFAAKRKLERLAYQLVESIAIAMYGGRFDERHGVVPQDAPGRRPRPRWVQIPIRQLAEENCTDEASAQTVLGELERIGVLLRRKLGRDAWYSLDMAVLRGLPDRTPKAARPQPAEPPQTDTAVDDEAYNRASWTVSLAPSTTAKPFDIPPVAERVEIINEGPVPIEVVSRIQRDREGGVWEFLVKASVENAGVTVKTTPKEAEIPQLELGYSYSFEEFQKFLAEVWGRYGFAHRLGVWPDQKVAEATYRALDGAGLQHFSVVLANYAPNSGNRAKAGKLQSVGFLPHIAADCAKHKDRWNGGAVVREEVVDDGPSRLETFLEENPGARENLERLKAMKAPR